ncbi:hypothetical protein [Grimontia sp. NTOU-MAR1]|uniref:hypothetical protein n=1 Tax=Grimontia sp. NTOU-MAR1 TaxID=3111011 RepID=UPI002DBE9B05|nr:hypothetical protein [Grimontia sp. NTOU-MAR1]WRW00065.1 hypothetical protein VP504_24090 [Grimontia sp. NTOU-MAR1]
MIYIILPGLIAATFLVMPSLSSAAFIENSSAAGDVDVANAINFSQSQDRTVIEWQVEDHMVPTIWDSWNHDWDIPHFLSAQTGASYYGFGVWKPEEYQQQSFTELGMEDWLLNHGLNFSFTTESSSTDARYRFDMRWHEETNTEFLLQMQVPFK